ncbi:MAG TPA: shikimate kinase [Opitutaceae bacterium]|nr:shikimate kinase [Opitutaceae bacterium]
MQPPVNLYLVGFMGSGKSTVGWQVAKALQYQFLDSDKEIEKAAGRPISEIFATEGEAAFRARERDFVERGHPAEGCVVACGGGLIVPDGMLARLRQRGIVVCLHAPLETILERTSRNALRPLLQVADPMARIQQLFAQREPIYRAAGTVVLTDKRPLREIVTHVLRVYREELRDRARGR